MTLSLVKTGAIAAALVFATATSSLAATYAIVEQDSLIRYNHSNSSSVVNDVEEGDLVQIIGEWGNWYKIAIPGPNGWIRSYKLELDYEDDPAPGVQFCFMGPLGKVCVKG
ncbi:MAG: hypothetical protein ABIO40_12110 [Devosia sp.]